MRTSTEGVVLRGLTKEEAWLQLVEARCKTCREGLAHYISAPTPQLADWLIHKPCGHTKLCLIWAICQTCTQEFLTCKHCGLPHCCANCSSLRPA